MLDAREGDVDPALRDQEFTGKSVWKRIAIVAAGPGFNLIFTIAAFWLMFMLGRPDVAPMVTATPHSMAAEAGIQPGRPHPQHRRAAGVDLDRCDGSSWPMPCSAATPLPLTVRGTDGAQRQVVLPLNELPAGQDIGQYLDKLGLQPAPPPAVAATVMAGTARGAGRHAGRRPHRQRQRPAGRRLRRTSASWFQAEAAKSPALAIVVERDGQPSCHCSVTAQWESLEGQPTRNG